MAMSNRERIAKGMEQTRLALIPYVEREFKARLGANWFDQISSRLDVKRGKDGTLQWDTQALVKSMGDNWQSVFRHALDNHVRNFVGELREVRNRWAHDDPFSSDDTYRALDTMQRLLEELPARAEAEEVGKLKTDLQRTVFAEQARSKTRSQLTLEGMPAAGLKPWREVVTPHPDVASGRYMQAEFAADLAQVAAGEGSDEYRDPIEFFRRTFITAGLKDLLVGALQRLCGEGGDPVVELQTNFGGGKTHSMLALFHLFGETPATKLAGLEEVLKDAGVTNADCAKRAVLVGTHMSPGEVHQKDDGTAIRTMWGELAWQLGRAEGYKLVADSDARAVSPGAAVLTELFRRYSPCLVLIDEWVAYARQVVGKRDLPAGDFEAQATFAQAITEAAKNAPRTLVVASIPASKLEIGGEHGMLALETLKNVFERVGKPWHPATGDEGFEIVRRRLFEPIGDKDAFANRDAVVNSFTKLYRDGSGDFPSGCSEGAYSRELVAAYPIHPELFRRLYDDWSTLDKFQRTRGVLRLLAKVIHRLWESQDAGLMIMPSSIPMDDGAVKSELTRYLEDVWEPIISQDVDGENSLPLELDRSTPNLGRVSACRRVARTIYMGTAPNAGTTNAGVDDRRIRLGCAQPGEPIGAFGDALRRISDKAKYIHQDGNRYWISTKPNLNRMAEDRASANLREPEVLQAEIVRRLMLEQKQRGEFAAVYPAPESTSEVEDKAEAGLVILSPKHPHRKGQMDSAAIKAAKEILENKGSGPRLERNCLVFLAADKKELDALMEATAQYLAWRSIDEENESLNLDAFQRNQAKKKREDGDGTVGIKIGATWIHALVPTQPEPTSEIVWEEIKVSGNDPLAKRTGSKLILEGDMLMPVMGGVRLRRELDKYLWTDKDHVSVAQLAEWFARYLYLPRVVNRETLVRAIHDGAHQLVIDDTFAVAAGYDEAKERYLGLTAGGSAIPVIDKGSLVVKPEVARRQLEQDRGISSDQPTGSVDTGQGDGAAAVMTSVSSTGSTSTATATAVAPTYFHGSAVLDPTRIGRDAGRIAEEIIQHLSTLPGAEVEISMEISIRVSDGIKDDVVRTVTENANTLKLQSHGFERE